MKEDRRWEFIREAKKTDEKLSNKLAKLSNEIARLKEEFNVAKFQFIWSLEEAGYILKQKPDSLADDLRAYEVNEREW